ncbi:MAG: potassium-transporting ATPase subunit KdpC [Acidobacteriota bacterium]
MFARYVEQFKPACLLFLWLTLITGLGYPLVVTALGASLFPAQARGSLVTRDGVVMGSALIGQPFAAPGYFTGRPSATAPEPYNAAASAGSNLAASNPALREAVAERARALRDGRQDSAVPMDLVTASASGLDPHISPAAAAWQVQRVAAARGLPAETVAALVARHTEERLWGFWGERRVSVLGLNLALDALPRPQ